jgi:hypothetical protein
VDPRAGLDDLEKINFLTTGIRTPTTQSSSPQSSSPGRAKNFLFSASSRLALGPTQLRIQWVTGSLSPGVKRPGREAGHSPPTSAEVKKMWVYTSTPPSVFMA